MSYQKYQRHPILGWCALALNVIFLGMILETVGTDIGDKAYHRQLAKLVGLEAIEDVRVSLIFEADGEQKYVEDVPRENYKRYLHRTNYKVSIWCSTDTVCYLKQPWSNEFSWLVTADIVLGGTFALTGLGWLVLTGRLD